jgi:peptidoglycan/LPS O-acetylase OafA/YrhL
MKYRPEIDGLRAIAVIPVIFFHAGASAISGGYIGVDIFFVISGYLITKIIIDDLEKGNFSQRRFYARRARRILPALFFVLLLCILPAWFFMSGKEFQEFSNSLLAAATFSSNIIFWLQSGYFDSAAELKPLLHTWSLAVEEQFYILFPIYLTLLWKNYKKLIPISIIFLSLLSLILSEIGLRYFPTANYYLAPTRIWEIFSGSLAALLLQKYRIRANNKLSIIGFILILLAIFIYDKNTPYPGFYTTVPVIGSLLIILYADQNSYIGRFLSNKILVTMGMTSFSAYLLHQPIFAFARIILPKTELTLMIALAFLVFPLAYLCWKFIEKPFRDAKNFSENQVLISAFLSITLLVTLSLALKYANAAISEPISTSKSHIEDKKNERFKYVGLVCTEKGWDACNTPQKNKINILSIGDSHEVDGYNSIYLALESNLDKISLSSSNLGGCPPHRSIRETVPPTHPDLIKCESLNVKRFDTDYLKYYDVIAVSAMFGWYSEKNMIDYLNYLKQNFKGRVIIFGGTFGFSKALPEIYNKSNTNDATDPEIFINFDPRLNEKELRNYASENNFLFISKIDAFCPHSRCQFIFEKDLLTYDQHHLSLAAVHRFTDKNKEKIKNYILNSPNL